MKKPSVRIRDKPIEQMKRRGWQFEGAAQDDQKELSVLLKEFLDKGARAVALTREVSAVLSCAKHK